MTDAERAREIAERLFAKAFIWPADREQLAEHIAAALAAVRAEQAERIAGLEWDLGDAIDEIALRKARIAELERECERLREVATREPHHAYLEAVQRACDERLGEQKHALRHAETRIAELERDRDEALTWIAEATKTITGLSGGGSENFVRHRDSYCADLPFCAQRIRERFDRPVKMLRELRARAERAEAQLAQAQERIATLEHELEDWKSACRRHAARADDEVERIAELERERDDRDRLARTWMAAAHDEANRASEAEARLAQAPQPTPHHPGCICPARSEETCRAVLCPRQSLRLYSRVIAHPAEDEP